MTLTIAFSLFGDKPLYVIGMAENIRLAPVIYPAWRVKVYCDLAGARALGPLIDDRVTLEVRRPAPAHLAAFWRFESVADHQHTYDASIFRDADSRLNVRESAAVAQWLDGDALYHVMHDHPHHAGWPIMAGMWGARGTVLGDMPQRIAAWGEYEHKLQDMNFLAQEIWYTAQRSCCHHSSVDTGFPALPFEVELPNGGFVGEIIQL